MWITAENEIVAQFIYFCFIPTADITYKLLTYFLYIS